MRPTKHIYALGNWSAERRQQGWFIAKTASRPNGERHRWKGPYGSITSATLMIARELARELDTRHARATGTDHPRLL
jgi:hypothetical protein